MGKELLADRLGFFGSAIRIAMNARSTQLNRELVGTTITGQPYGILRKECLAYAAATKDQASSYEPEDGAAPPLFSVKVLAPTLSRLLLHRDLGMNFLKMLHGEQALSFHAPLRYGQSVIPEATIQSIRDVSTGEIADIALEIRSPDGTPLVSGTSSFFISTGKSSGAPSKGDPKKASPEAVPFPEDAPGRFSRPFKTDPDQPRRYASASGDGNPIHTNRIIARLSGLPSPIMHGLCMMAMAGAEVIAATQAKPQDLKELSLRFARPAFPGADYVIHGANSPQGGVDFVVLDKKERPVLTRGFARVERG